VGREAHCSLRATKGRDAVFGERAVRDAMRNLGHVDTRVCAVSAMHSATRYSFLTASQKR
jgi:hypothetical protein